MHCFLLLLIGQLQLVIRGSVLCNVGESVHHAAAQSAAGDLHVMDGRPLTSFDIVTLNVKSGGEAVKAPDHKQAVINHCDAKVAAGAQHGGHRMPGVGVRVVGLNSAQTGRSSETTNLLHKG